MTALAFVMHCMDLLKKKEDDVVVLILPRELFPEKEHHGYFGCNVCGVPVIPHDGSMTLFFTREDWETFQLFEFHQRSWGCAMHYYDHCCTELEQKARKGHVQDL